jgi:tetratricopeptide (TPR) repeat protein
MVVSADLLRTGWRFHEAGDLPRAEAAYRQLVRQEPDNAQGWYLLGALYQSEGALPAAADCLEQALRLRPAYPEALNYRGIVCARQGQLAEAAARFREALRLKAGDAETQTNLAVALVRQGQRAEAAALLHAVLQRRPDYARAHAYLRQAQPPPAPAGADAGAAAAGHNDAGVGYRRQGRLDEAARCFRQALELRPDFPEAYANLGLVLAGQGAWDEAVACCQQALRLRPDCAEAFNNLGLALRGQRRYAEAEASYRQALGLRPGSAEVHSNLGVVLVDLQQLDEAQDCFARAVRLKPDYAEAHSHLGAILCRLGQPEQALVSLRQALQLRPDFAEALNNLGLALRDLGRFEEALRSFQDALQVKPDCAEAHVAAAAIRLQLGDFDKGWPDYEWRWQLPDAPSRNFPQPLWDGSPLAGRRILLYAEQGLGDTFQFVRYARLVQERGGTVIVECQRFLRRILAGCPGIDELVGEGEPLPPHDVRAPLMSLPLLFGTRIETIPATIPYLTADPVLVEQWRGRFAALAGFKIGINWQGNPQFRFDKQRSFTVTEFAPLAAVPGVQLVSLQHGPASEQLRAVAAQWPITDLGGRLDEEAGPFMDRAAVLMHLDLVVTSDTSIAHLAGALGVPVWVALGKAPYWCFLLEREDTPWYPTMRLFRQERTGEWGPVFERIAEAVRARSVSEGQERPALPLRARAVPGADTRRGA